MTVFRLVFDFPQGKQSRVCRGVAGCLLRDDRAVRPAVIVRGWYHDAQSRATSPVLLLTLKLEPTHTDLFSSGLGHRHGTDTAAGHGSLDTPLRRREPAATMENEARFLKR